MSDFVSLAKQQEVMTTKNDLSFMVQYEKHTKDISSWNNIAPMSDWELEDYKLLHRYIQLGILFPHEKYKDSWTTDYCDDCEGECHADEMEECEDCGIKLRIGCANNPSDHSISDDVCDNCREAILLRL